MKRKGGKKEEEVVVAPVVTEAPKDEFEFVEKEVQVCDN